jgi:hypothetical protein
MHTYATNAAAYASSARPTHLQPDRMCFFSFGLIIDAILEKLALELIL